jgi:hypothetical protein
MMDLKVLQVTPPWEWPEAAAKTFRKVLVDPQADASDRLFAAELAGDFTVINDDLAGVLMAILRNPDEPEKLRARAAISFGAALEDADINEFDDPDDVRITEPMFHSIKKSLQELYVNTGIPKEVRRRILEASVRAAEDWHKDAISSAYASGDQEWMLTAVFAMRWIRGFDTQILDALRSTNPEIHYEAVQAAGAREVAAAWPHIRLLIKDARTPKDLLLAAIEAVGSIRPREARKTLGDLMDSDDEDIAEAATEAVDMAEMRSGDEDDEEDASDPWVN